MLTQVLLMGLWYHWISQFELYNIYGERFNKFDGLYLLCGAVAILGMGVSLFRPRALSKREVLAAGISGAVYGLMTVLANYPVFEENWWRFVPAVLGGSFVGWQIMTLCLGWFPLKQVSGEGRTHPARLFLVTFGSMAAVYLLYFFCVAYPGLFSRDSFAAVGQCLSGSYDNTSPFWHTMVVKLCLEAGALLGLSITDSVAIYGLVQSLAMAAVFAYVLVTLYQAGMPKLCLGLVWLVYGLAVYNITYSVTLWKDIPFSLGMLAMVTALYRILKNIGGDRANYIVFTVGSLFFCLMRTNGVYSCLVMTLCLLPAFRRLEKKLLVILCAVVALGWACNGPVIEALGVSGGDFVEALAVPFQQITRVVDEELDMTEDDMEMIEEIFDVDTVRELHDPLSVNDMKFEAFRRDKQEYLKENLGEYAKLWLRLGLHHPWTYTKAWIDETVGYWNAGYSYWIYPELDLDKKYADAVGVARPELDNPVQEIFEGLFHIQHANPLVAQPLLGIGFQVWIFLLCLIVCAVKKRQEAYLGIPVLVILVGLWLGTPVFAEFRYAYPVFVTVPLLLPITLFEKK